MTTSSVSPVTTELAGSETGITLVITPERAVVASTARLNASPRSNLICSAPSMPDTMCWNPEHPAHEAVVAAIHVMEDAPEFNAGRGAALTSDGIAPDGTPA